MGINAGAKLGPYAVVAAIGAGGMGEVYRATDTRLGRDVAIKVLSSSLTKDSERLARFEQEARTVAALNHPNILGIHDIGDYEGAPFLVSELLEGQTLRQRILEGPIPTRRAIEYALGIAQGLAAAHDKGIVHRDLKPENVFITRDGRVKILDFGLAKLLRDEGSLETATTLTMGNPSTMPGVVMGTIGYMSPEQVRGEVADGRSDIFSFGVVLYEMLTGRRAFKKDTAAETMTAILKDEPPELTETGWQGPLALQKILSRCLEKSPERRFQSASDLAFAIEALSGTGISPTAAAAAIKPSFDARRWLLFGAAGLGGLALGAALAWALRPAAKPVPTFERLSFDRGTVIHGRYLSDGKTVVYSGVLRGGVPDTYVIREDYPASVSVGLGGAMVLSVSKQDQLAVLVRPHFWGQYVWEGTLARVPMGDTAPRELLENVSAADWSPNGNDLAVIDRKNDKWQVEYPIGKVLLTTDNWLSDLRVSPDGKRLALFRHPAGSKDDRGVVVLFDRDGKQKVISQEWEALEGLAWSADGREVWYSAAESGDQYCLRASTLEGKNRVVYCGTSGTRLHDITATGRALVSTQAGRFTTAVIQHGSKDEHDLYGMGSSINPRLSPDGSEVISTDISEHGGSDYLVYAQKTAGGPPVRIGEGGYGTDISDDGKWVLVVLPGETEGKVQVIPVGAGESKTLRWEGFQVSFANWFPDNQHILLFGGPVGQNVGLYMSDRDGAAPKLLVKDAPGWADVMPDGENLLLMENNTLLQHSIKDGAEKKLRTLQAGELPVDWAAEPGHLFTQMVRPTQVEIDKIDLNSDKRENWQMFEPSDQQGSLLNVLQVSITPDGRWMMINYHDELGQFYGSDSLR
ncbi:MAG TPA: protein kinase [Candidatus Sulfotelmatobacter sp.]|nr:protein kinase [Candidatus Sulfotelmatobacter sp.]